ncbi:N-acetyltransferase family protein [Natrialbaceae archaeon A-gly3]
MYEGYADVDRSMGLPPIQSERLETWLDSLLEEGMNYVARQGDQIVGHAVYTPFSTSEPTVIVFVDTDHYDRGIGSELCRHLIAHATENDHKALVLDVDSANERAIHVYRRMGFWIVKRRDTAFRMRLPLDSRYADRVQRPPTKR